MIRKIILWTDTHIGAPHQLIKNTEEIEKDYYQFKDNPEVLVICTGDIIDNKNVPKHDADMYAFMRDSLKKLMQKYYIFGNHECEPPETYYEQEEGVMWMHYHVYDWCDSFTNSCEKVIKWENKKEGLKRWKYFGYRFKHLVIKRGKQWKPSKETIADIVAFAKMHNCHTIAFGHTHKLYDQVHDGVRIINGGRGRHVYTLD